VDYGDKLNARDWYIFAPPRWYIFLPPLTHKRRVTEIGAVLGSAQTLRSRTQQLLEFCAQVFGTDCETT
jgi:hypothetical protein